MCQNTFFMNSMIIGEVKAIGGVRVKKIMLSFFERSQYGGKDAFYGIKISYRVQKLSQFKVRKFRSVSYKKDEKNWNLGYFTQNVSTTAVQARSWWNLDQRLSTCAGAIPWMDFWKFWKFQIWRHFSRQKMLDFLIFYLFFA